MPHSIVCLRAIHNDDMSKDIFQPLISKVRPHLHEELADVITSDDIDNQDFNYHFSRNVHSEWRWYVTRSKNDGETVLQWFKKRPDRQFVLILQQFHNPDFLRHFQNSDDIQNLKLGEVCVGWLKE